MAKAPRPPTLPQRRFRLLCEQLLAEAMAAGETSHEAAGRISVDPGLFGKIVKGVRNGGAINIDRAMKRLGLRYDFFHDPALKEPHYRAFIGPAAGAQVREAQAPYGGWRSDPDAELPGALRQLIAQDPRCTLRRIDALARAHLSRSQVKGRASLADFRTMLDALVAFEEQGLGAG